LPSSNNRFPFPATLAEIVPKFKEEEKGEAKKNARAVEGGY